MLSREFDVIPYFVPCICFAFVVASKILKNLAWLLIASEAEIRQ
jgi:hypothetical protein